MRITATFYIDVISSWCYWAEPAWQELKKRYEGQVHFEWKVALMDKSGLPASLEQHEWFYRRSGVMMRAPFKLKSDWCNHDETEFLAPNCVAKAAADLGATDDRVRLALAHAALREGQSVGQWDTAAEVGAKAAGLKIKELLERAQSPAIEKRVREETADYHRLQVTQRPTFVFDSEIGDRAILSGFAKVEPLAAALDSMIEDCAAYESHGVHFGAPPA
jgi:predicted DsbA family dithiol-disulfide isomerase